MIKLLLLLMIVLLYVAFIQIKKIIHLKKENKDSLRRIKKFCK